MTVEGRKIIADLIEKRQQFLAKALLDLEGSTETLYHLLSQLLNKIKLIY
jgi:DNA-binding MarR family transcriptional regulator